MTLEELREEFPDAALVWAHPFRWGKMPFGGELKNPIIDAVEILNCNQSDEENSMGVAHDRGFDSRQLAEATLMPRVRLVYIPPYLKITSKP